MMASRMAATRAAMTAQRMQNTQRRGFVDYLVKYPDKIAEKKKIQCAGGTCQGDMNPTWLKQPGDSTVALAGFALVGIGMAQWVVGIYHLASGKGKLD